MENISSIQIRENVKRALERLKEKPNESYEEVIIKILRDNEMKKRKQRELLIESYKEMAEESLRITREWEDTDATLDWECKDLIPEKYLKGIK